MIFAAIAILQQSGPAPEWAVKMAMDLQNSGMSISNGWGFHSRHSVPPRRSDFGMAIFSALTTAEEAIVSFKNGPPKPKSDRMRDIWQADPWIVSSWANRVPDLLMLEKEAQGDPVMAIVHRDVPDLLPRIRAIQGPLAAIKPRHELHISGGAKGIVEYLRKEGWLPGFPEFGTRKGQIKSTPHNYAVATATAVVSAYRHLNYSSIRAEHLAYLVAQFRYPLHASGWLESSEHEENINYWVTARANGDSSSPPKSWIESAKKHLTELKLERVE